MLYTPKAIADFLVKTYGSAPKGVILDREAFEKQADRYGVDHRLVRSIDLELRPMGYILFDLLQEQHCVVLMRISMVMEALAHEDMPRAG
jgi:hypothetical protein